jgi:hypothetical protein
MLLSKIEFYLRLKLPHVCEYRLRSEEDQDEPNRDPREQAEALYSSSIFSFNLFIYNILSIIIKADAKIHIFRTFCSFHHSEKYTNCTPIVNLSSLYFGHFNLHQIYFRNMSICTILFCLHVLISLYFHEISKYTLNTVFIFWSITLKLSLNSHIFIILFSNF